MKRNKSGETKEIETVIREEIHKRRNLGEHARGGSDRIDDGLLVIYTYK